MLQSDFERFRALMTGMSQIYGREIDTPTLDAYWVVLNQWNLPAFESAVGCLLSSSKFMPRPADFNALLNAEKFVAGEAWTLAVKSCTTARIPGGHAGGSSGDPLIDRAVEAIGGYGAIAMCALDKLPFMERRFCEHYAEMGIAEARRTGVSQITRDEATSVLAKITNRLS